MQPELVSDLFPGTELTARKVAHLPANVRSRLLNFLLRWQHLDALHDCLDALTADNSDLVSLLDLRVQALLGAGRADEALAVMDRRLQLKTSLTARALLARVHLARGDAGTARQIAHTMTAEQSGSVLAWGLLGEVELAGGDTDAALAAYRRMGALRSYGRGYLLGMVAVHQALGDWVTASGYAVRALQSADEEMTLSALYLRRLRDYFVASGEETRVAEMEAELDRMRAQELSELYSALSFRPAAAAPSAPSAAPVRPEPLLPTFEQIPVALAERERVVDAARRLFGFTTLLPGQVETVACVLRGESVLTILPTGGGKSLCYQLPALLAERGVTLVISPLIALMKDQLDSLPEGLRAQATAINSSLEGNELVRRLGQLTGGCYRLVYAAPERLRQPPFLHALRRAGVNRLVIDEAHCVSMWGHDFRPDYLAIGAARQTLGDPPLLALTATAPEPVRREMMQRLGALRLVAGDVTRPNLFFEVLHAANIDDKLRHLVAFCQAETGSGIVYAGTRSRCEELAALLRRRGVAAGHYHAGIANRAQVQDDFMAGRVRVVVATVAFGLGIDKPDIRFIVHLVPPESLEAYYQEAGRAGRDGQPACCLLMFSSSDRGTLTRRSRENALPVEFLRTVYAAVKRRLNGASAGRVALADLERDVQSDDVRVRVALSMLEQTGLLRRGPDLPHAALVSVGQGGGSSAWEAFCQAARLRAGQWQTLDVAEAAQRAGMALDGVEMQLLEWADAGWLDYRPSGRDLLLELLPAPPDAAARIAALLERYETVQAQRVDEIAAYARTPRCRHGHINAYLGGRAIERCTVCDNCVEPAALPQSRPPDEREHLLTVLRCVADSPWSWGRQTLLRILRGDASARPGARPLHEQARANACFGALTEVGPASIQRQIDRLERAGFLQARRLENNYTVLDLTASGQEALGNPAALDGVIEREG